MLILGIDTATPWGTVALCRDEDVLFEVSLRKLKGGGEYLLALLEQLMETSGVSFKKIDLIAAGTGPGSYTGIRVGLAAVSGLAEGLQVPVCPLSTLEIIAENCRKASRWIVPVIDARRAEVYTALYEATPEGLREVRPPAARPVEEWARSLSEIPELMVCGDGSKEYIDIWNGYNNVTIAPAYWDRPLGSMAAQCARRAWKSGSEPGYVLKPSYLKRVEAEIRLEEAKDGRRPNLADDTGGRGVGR